MDDAILMRPALLKSSRVRGMVEYLATDPTFITNFSGHNNRDVLAGFVVSTLMQVWATVKQVAPDGYLLGAGLGELDNISGVPSFGHAMRHVCWAEVLLDGVLLPNFQEHNGAAPAARTPTRKAMSEAQAARFEVFWKEYPKKVGKGAARSQWLKVWPDGPTADAIMAAVQKHKLSEQWRKDDGQFIPNPATWLSQERWTDEVSGVQESPAEDEDVRVRRVVEERRRLIREIEEARRQASWEQ